MGSTPVRSMFHERPGCRVDSLARTNVMSAWYWRVAGGEGSGIAWSYPESFPEAARLAGCVACDQDEVRVTMGMGSPTGVRP